MVPAASRHTPGVAELAHELRPLVFGLYDYVRRHSGRLPLTPTQSSVLSVLVHDGPQRMGVLAEREGVRLPTMTNVIARMERLGYVRRGVDPDDRRAVLVQATDRARDDVAAVVLAREEFLRERLTGLDEQDRQSIAASIDAFTRLLGETEENGR